MTTKTQEIFIGIDISKTQMDVAIWGNEETWEFHNEAEGWQELVEKAKSLNPSLIVVEASGGIERPLVAELYLEKLPIAPTRVRNFARSTGKLAKTDKLDARLIAHFAQAVRPLRTAEQEHLHALVTRRRQVVQILTAEKNRRATTYSTLRERLQQHIDWLEAEIKALNEEIEQYILLKTERFPNLKFPQELLHDLILL